MLFWFGVFKVTNACIYEYLEFLVSYCSVVARVVDTKENNSKACYFFFQTIKGKVKAGKVDCQAYAQTCQKAGIRAYPTVRLYPYERAKVGTRFRCVPFL